MSYKYKVSVVIPIYNVENYLEEALESVLEQTLGFKKHIQLILVNDGSPDNSEEICLRYKQQFPENIVYLKQENTGVSAARNKGMEYIEGEYVNFLDSDDKWEKHALQQLALFLDQHTETDVVCARVKNFEANDRFHMLDYKFSEEDRCVNLLDEENIACIQLQSATALYRFAAIQDIRYDVSLKYGEDAIFVNTVLLKKCQLGLMRSVIYLYRKRNTKNSAVQTQRFDRHYYLDAPRLFLQRLLEMSKKRFGSVIPYIQNLLAYDLGWRAKLDLSNNAILNGQELSLYIQTLSEISQCIDDQYIIFNRVHTSILVRKTIMKIKYGKNILKDFVFHQEDGSIKYQDFQIVGLRRSRNVCYINILEIKNNIVHINGRFAKWLLESTKAAPRFVIRFNDQEVVPQLSIFEFNKETTLFGEEYSFYAFSCTFDLAKLLKTKKLLRIKPRIYFGNECTDVGMNYGKFVSNTKNFDKAYRIEGRFYIRSFRTVIHIGIKDRKKFIAFEKDAIKWLIQQKEFKICWLRAQYFLYRKVHKTMENIWLISDRTDKAGDNGEALFKYLCANKPERIRPIFVISKYSVDYKRMKKIGETICYEDKKYQLYFLLADKIISASGAEYVINPFGDKRKYLVDLFKFKFVFLQHGIIMNDLSSWLQRYGKNIGMFVTSAEKEYNSIRYGNYMYDDQVKLTGLARFDYLENNPQKQLLILPTWRRSISQSYDSETKSVYFDGFKETEYFQFYNQLINDSRLLEVMKKHGYEGVFCLHPIHEKQHVDFNGNDVFSINHGFVDYPKRFSEGSLMVTDYSSVFFDFCYLKKPVIYAQFDKEAFFSAAVYDEGYFSYERDGFGPVCYNLDSTVDQIIHLIENDCKMDQEYQSKTDAFYAFNDRNNCQRICDEILKLN